jgi:putative photosynthetic complex assembly protein
MSATHHHIHDTPFPRFALVIAGTLVGTVLLATTVARVVGMQPTASPVAERAAAHVAAIKARDLRFVDQSDGSLSVLDAKSGDTAGGVAVGATSGFIRGVMRGLARERHKYGVSAKPSFRLTLWANGQLSLTDPSTGRVIELSGFGDTNRAAFLALLK